MIILTHCLFVCCEQRKAWSREGNGDSGKTVSNAGSNIETTTTAHSKVTAAPGANPQQQGVYHYPFTTAITREYIAI